MKNLPSPSTLESSWRQSFAMKMLGINTKLLLLARLGVRNSVGVWFLLLQTMSIESCHGVNGHAFLERMMMGWVPSPVQSAVMCSPNVLWHKLRDSFKPQLRQQLPRPLVHAWHAGLCENILFLSISCFALCTERYLGWEEAILVLAQYSKLFGVCFSMAPLAALIFQLWAMKVGNTSWRNFGWWWAVRQAEVRAGLLGLITCHLLATSFNSHVNRVC